MDSLTDRSNSIETKKKHKKSGYITIIRIVINLVILAVIVILFPKAVQVGGDFWRDYLYDMGYTKYKLSLDEMNVLNETLDITISRCKGENNIFERSVYYANNIYEYDKKNYKLMEMNNTYKCINKLNDILFESNLCPEARDIAEEYGFNVNNPITAEWILTHPKETVAILDACETLKKELRDYHVDLLYEK